VTGDRGERLSAYH
jgi:hypothetical protein